MWKLRKALMIASLKYPAAIGIHLIRHNKVAPTVKSEYNIHYGSHRLQCYDVHTKLETKDLTTIFYIHGGSWISIDKFYYNYIIKSIAEDSYRVVNINYRLLPKVTLNDVVEDSEKAIKHALDNIKGINPDKLMIMGDSAGAHLAALIAAKANSGTYNFNLKFIACGLFYGLFDMNDMIHGEAFLFKFLTEYFRREVGDTYEEYLNNVSPSKYYDQNYPPTFLTSGKVDALNPATMTFIENLKKSGIKYEALIFDENRKDGLHGFLSYTWLDSSKSALKALLDFFRPIRDGKTNE